MAREKCSAAARGIRRLLLRENPQGIVQYKTTRLCIDICGEPHTSRRECLDCLAPTLKEFVASSRRLNVRSTALANVASSSGPPHLRRSVTGWYSAAPTIRWFKDGWQEVADSRRPRGECASRRYSTLTVPRVRQMTRTKSKAVLRSPLRLDKRWSTIEKWLGNAPPSI